MPSTMSVVYPDLPENIRLGWQQLTTAISTTSVKSFIVPSQEQNFKSKKKVLHNCRFYKKGWITDNTKMGRGYKTFFPVID